MEKIGFWESFFDESLGAVERERLNEAATEINSLSLQNNHAWRQIQRLFALDKAQSAELEKLRVTVQVLTEAMIDAEVLDRTLVAERLGSAFTALELRRNPKAPGTGGPFRGGESAGADPNAAAAKVATTPAKPEPKTLCGMCGESVPARMTTITETGVVCDPCFESTSG